MAERLTDHPQPDVVTDDVSAIYDAMRSDAWHAKVPTVPGPTVHLDITIRDAAHGLLLVRHIEKGRPVSMTCAGATDGCDAQLTGEVSIPFDALLDLFDPDVDDPLLRVLAPPTTLQMPFEMLFYLGGVVDGWVGPLRSLVAPEVVARCREASSPP
jgi:hypothetical protein